MAKVIFAGYRRSYESMLRKALADHAAQLPGWDWTLFPGHSKTQAILAPQKVEELLELCASLDGCPIVAVSEDRSRGDVAKRIAPFFRFRWVDAQVVNAVARREHLELINVLVRVVAEEHFWAEKIRPTKFASPLMLPSQFAAARQLEPIWRLARSYNDQENLEAASEMITRFTSEHRKKIDSANATPWVDRHEWVWRDDGARHGNPEFPDCWKLSYRVPDGQHFDVTPRAATGIFTDARGSRHPLAKKKQYWNITVHGFVRGAGSVHL